MNLNFPLSQVPNNLDAWGQYQLHKPRELHRVGQGKANWMLLLGFAQASNHWPGIQHPERKPQRYHPLSDKNIPNDSTT